MRENKIINKIILIFMLVLFLFITVACDKKSDVEETSEVVCLNGELYSDETQSGLIMSAVVSYFDLEVKRKNITCYGFAYLYSCPSTIDSIVLGNEGVYEVTVEDVDSSNNINCIITIPEEHYNTDMAFRPFIKYLDSDGKEQVLYSSTYNASNLYELALKDNCQFARDVVESVEKTK